MLKVIEKENLSEKDIEEWLKLWNKSKIFYEF